MFLNIGYIVPPNAANVASIVKFIVTVSVSVNVFGVILVTLPPELFTVYPGFFVIKSPFYINFIEYAALSVIFGTLQFNVVEFYTYILLQFISATNTYILLLKPCPVIYIS